MCLHFCELYGMELNDSVEIVERAVHDAECPWFNGSECSCCETDKK